MDLKRRHFFLPVLSLVIIALLVAGYCFFNPFNNSLSPFDAVPNNVSAILEIHNNEEVIPDNIIKHFPESEVIYSYHFDGETIQSLFIAAKPKSTPGWLNSLPDDLQSSTISTYNGVKIYEGHFINGNTKLFTCKNKNLIISSTSVATLKQSIEQLKNRSSSVQNMSHFIEVRKTAGKGVMANLYLQNRQLFDIIGTIFTPFSQSFLINIPEQSWSCLDVLVKDDEILLNGFTSPRSYSSDSQSDLGNSLEMLKILPSDILFGCGMDFLSIQPGTDDKASDYLQIKNIPFDFQSYLSGRISAGLLYNSRLSTDNNLIGVAEVSNPEGLLNYLVAQSREINTTQEVFETGENSPLEVLFAPVFSPNHFRYYTLVDTLLIVAENPDVLTYAKNYIKRNISVATSDQFKGLRNNLSSHAVFSFYLDLQKTSSFIAENLPGMQLDSNWFWQNSAHSAFSLQYLPVEEMMYTGSSIRTKPLSSSEPSAAAKIETVVTTSTGEILLDHPVSQGPYLVFNHQTNKNNLIVFDSANYMYRINHDGSITWTATISGQPLSDVYQVDRYNNGKVQYLFNTKEKLYLVDINGNSVEGFPVILPANATNGIALFDYNNTKEYRILVACQDKKVYNYSVEGKQVQGWKTPTLNAVCTETITLITHKRKDYIIIPKSNNEVLMTDRRGSTRMVIRRSFTNAPQTGFFINHTNSKGFILTTDINGRLVYIPDEGKVAFTTFDSFTEEHYFFYYDIDNNGHRDFIYFDRNELKVFDRFKNLIYSKQFLLEVKRKPQMFTNESGQVFFNLYNPLVQKSTIISFSSQPGLGEDYSGQTRIAIGQFGLEDSEQLIFGRGNEIIFTDVQ